MTNARLTLIVLVTRSVVRIHVKSSVFNRHEVSVIYFNICPCFSCCNITQGVYFTFSLILSRETCNYRLSLACLQKSRPLPSEKIGEGALSPIFSEGSGGREGVGGGGLYTGYLSLAGCWGGQVGRQVLVFRLPRLSISGGFCG